MTKGDGAGCIDHPDGNTIRVSDRPESGSNLLNNGHWPLGLQSWAMLDGYGQSCFIIGVGNPLMGESDSDRTTVHRGENVLLVGERTVSEFFDGGGITGRASDEQ